MDIVLFVSFLILFDGCQSYVVDNAKISKRRFDFIPDIDIDSVLNSRFKDFVSVSNKRSNGDERSGENMNLETIALESTITSSGGTSNKEVTLTVISLPSVDIYWTYFDATSDDTVITFGTFVNNGETISSSITFTTDMSEISMVLLGQTFAVYFEINKNAATAEMTYTLANFLDVIKDFSNVELNGKNLEFDIKQENRSTKPKIMAVYGSFGKDGSTPVAEVLRHQIAPLEGPGQFHVSCRLVKSGVDGQVWIGFKNSVTFIESDNSLVSASYLLKRIPIETNTPSAFGDFLVLPAMPGDKIIQLSPEFKYETLFCLAAGRPIPRVTFFKDGVLQESISKSYFGVFTVGFLPLADHTVEEASGRYVCKGTSGSQSLERHYVVEKIIQN